MANLSFYLDRRSASGNKFQLKLKLSINSTNTSIATKVYIYPEEFVEDRRRPIMESTADNVFDNDRLEDMYRTYDDGIYELKRSGRIRCMSPGDVRTYVDNKVEFQATMTFWDVYAIVYSECKKPKTQRTYSYMEHVLRRYLNGRKFLSFDEITAPWLEQFQTWMDNNSEVTGKNGIGRSSQGIILRNIRTIYNKAIRMGQISGAGYPFSQFRIKSERKQKEYLPIDAMRKIRDYVPTGAAANRARDMFLLSFYLCGINPIDMWSLSEIRDGYIYFSRSKTVDRNNEEIRIKVQPEAMEIINRWKGSKSLLDCQDIYTDYDSMYYAMKKQLYKIADELGIGNLKFYDARYSWSTYAAHENVPVYLIDKSLGHADTTVAEKHCTR